MICGNVKVGHRAVEEKKIIEITIGSPWRVSFRILSVRRRLWWRFAETRPGEWKSLSSNSCKPLDKSCSTAGENSLSLVDPATSDQTVNENLSLNLTFHFPFFFFLSLRPCKIAKGFRILYDNFTRP